MTVFGIVNWRTRIREHVFAELSEQTVMLFYSRQFRAREDLRDSINNYRAHKNP